MATDRVAFDGKWQERFADRDEAVEWARAVGETGRLVLVVKRRWFRPSLAAVFPEDRYEEGKNLWDTRMMLGIGLPG